MDPEIVFVKTEPETEACVKTEPTECVRIDSGLSTVDGLCKIRMNASTSQMPPQEPRIVHVKTEASNEGSVSHPWTHKVKEEPVDDTESTSTNQINMWSNIDPIHEVNKTSWLSQNGVSVKEEPMCEDSEDNSSICDSDAPADLNVKQEIKEEFVLGPESFQRPHAAVLTGTPIKVDRKVSEDSSSVSGEHSLVKAESGTDTRTNTDLCDHCGRGFSNDSSIKKYVCVCDSTSVPSRKDIQEFCESTSKLELLEIEHSLKNYMCPQCDYTTADKKSFKAHLKSHPEKKLLICTYCSYTTRNKVYFKRHLNIHTGEKLFKCSYCDMACHRKADIKKHEMRHTGEKPFKCDHCDYKCNRKSSLQLHQRRHTGEKSFHCSECDYKCSRKDSIQRHQLIHAEFKPFQCNLCDFKSYQRTNLWIHKRIHTGEKRFECNICHFKCRHRYTLQTHLMTHTGEKPYECNVCKYSCSRKTDLRKHQMTHTGDKPFKCTDCDYMCRQKSDLRKHQKKHSAETFECNDCDYKCNRKIDLRKHQTTHSGVTIFKCKHCSHETFYKYSLQRHMKRVHVEINPNT